jgi:acyl-coenzyme A thioesterase PaaI-like protein
MRDDRHPRVLGERRGRWLLNLYPPLLFNRVRILEIGAGFRSCRVRVARSLWTRNLHGTTFGGTIFSAADPFYAVMYWQIFARRGQRIQAWLKSARIRYRKPAATALILDFALELEEIERAAAGLAAQGRYTATYSTEAVDRDGAVCAEIETEVYLRLPRPDQPEVSAF